MKHPNWTILVPLPTGMLPHDVLGIIPLMLDEDDPAPATAQFDAEYAHGGGWRPFDGFKLYMDDYSIKYTGDPAIHPVAQAKLRDETIVLYPHAWVAVIQPDGKYEISRMD